MRFKVDGYTWKIICHLHQGHSFCDFVFALLNTKSLLKRALLYEREKLVPKVTMFCLLLFF